jgi:uncharacterized protein (DUF4415 family)
MSQGRTDWARVDRMTDDDIRRQIADDPDAAPEFTDEMVAQSVWIMPAKKVPISFRVDPDILDFFKAQGPGYQSRMNAVLRGYVRAHQGRRTKA